jgi:hypothetical protein
MRLDQVFKPFCVVNNAANRSGSRKHCQALNTAVKAIDREEKARPMLHLLEHEPLSRIYLLPMTDGKTGDPGRPMDNAAHAIGIPGIVSGIIGAMSIAIRPIVIPARIGRHTAIRISMGMNNVMSLHNNHLPVPRLKGTKIMSK